MPTLQASSLRAHERRVCRALEARGQPGLGEALVRLDGTPFGDGLRLETLYAVGGEGVVFLCSDPRDPTARLVAKLPLVPFHRPVELSSNFLRRRREQLREECRNLEASRSLFLPVSRGLHEFANPLLDHARGGEFDQPEPVLVMEWMPGFDLDVWLARVHRSDVPVALLRRNLDRVAVVLLKALVDLEDRGFHYADLRPGNLRMMGRPERRIRLLDAGSLVERGDESGRFPHVPAYLPPELFRRRQESGESIFPTAATQAVMAGRTLYEVATGRVPLPGKEIDRDALKESNVSAPVGDVIDGLATGSFEDVRPAMRYLEKRAVKRVALPGVAASTSTGASASAAAAAPQVPPAPRPRPAPAPVVPLTFETTPEPVHPPVVAAAPAKPAVRPAPAAPAAPAPSRDEPENDEILPPAPKRPWWKRLLGA